jgi:dihydroorotate dehydrogenase
MVLTKLINKIYTKRIKPQLFKQDPEKVHDRFMRTGRILGFCPIPRTLSKILFRYDNPKLEQTIDGIKYDNPIGLSAGFDKHVDLLNIIPSVGFGYQQVGSLTLHPYDGNPQPRLYRLPKSEALVVYYGLKNFGIEKSIELIKKRRKFKDFPLSISVAKTNNTETCDVDNGVEDYYGSVVRLEEENIGDMYTINISCPNTFGGEPFTDPVKLEKLLKRLKPLNIEKPVYIKMAVDLDWKKEFKPLLDIIVKYKFVKGVVIGNLTKKRTSKLIKDDIPDNVQGGISGTPTYELSNDLIENTYKEYGDSLTIIGVGGVFNAKQAYEKIVRGASLVQLITGMIYNGPQTIGEINNGLVELLEKDGFENIGEAVGSKLKNESK